MSLIKLVFPILSWSELWEIVSYLTLKELWRLGSTCRSGFITFLREKIYREGLKERHLSLSTYHPHARFLSKYSKHHKILLVSYPRSGNSYVRKMLELKTGIITGSDSRPNRTLAASLLKYGYCGEGITDQSVWIVKSHYPERLGFIRFPVDRIVLIVRNPFDAIESYFHMGMTNTHDKVLSDEAFQSLQEVWKEFLINECKVWYNFHEFWMNQLTILPITIIRYEDLLMNESLWMQEILNFLQQGRNPDGYQRFMKPVDDPKKNGVGYNPKNSRIGKSFQSIPDAEFQIIYQCTKKYLDLFQYQVAFNDVTLKPELQINPFHFHSLYPSLADHHQYSPMLLINDNLNIRDTNDKFGRKITDLRKNYTKNDSQPFPTK